MLFREINAARLTRGGFSRSGKLIISGVYSRMAAVPLSHCQRRLARQLGLDSTSQLIIDNRSETTDQNARNTHDIMKAHGWRSAVLVTSRSHMRRAMWTFEKQGVTVYPQQVPDLPPNGPNDWFSDVRRVHLKRFLYEYGALLKYKWYGYI